MLNLFLNFSPNVKFKHGGGEDKLIKLKRGTKTNMQAENPVLADGQPGYAYDSTGGILKVGDGTTAWNDLMTVANSEWDGTDIPLPISIANGGTGATTASAARSNLGITPANIGAAPTTHKHSANDINSGVLNTAYGGTGASISPNSAGILAMMPNAGAMSLLSLQNEGFLYTSGMDGRGQVDELGFKNIADYVVDQGTSGIWTWRKWNSGISECWGIENTASSTQQVEGGMYYSVKYVDFPKNLFIATPCTTVSAHGNWIGGAMTGTALSKTTYQGYLYTPTSAGHTRALQTMIHARGRWK